MKLTGYKGILNKVVDQFKILVSFLMAHSVDNTLKIRSTKNTSYHLYNKII